MKSVDLEETFVDRIISKSQVSELVGLSVSQFNRLEKDGVFPKRIAVGKRRVGYSFREVCSWIEEKKKLRDVVGKVGGSI